jgi:hypothetical protein
VTDYAPTTWVNNSAPAINATNLNHIEQGIVGAEAKIALRACANRLATFRICLGHMRSNSRSTVV